MRTQSLRLIMVAVAVATLAACSSSGGGSPTTSDSGGTASGEIKSGLKIAVIPKAVNNPYFDAAFEGAKKACTEIGATCDQIGPTEATGTAQVEFINTAVQQQYDAIVVSAADADAVIPALQAAAQAGIKVVTYDADVSDPTARLAMIKPTTPDLIGKAQVDWIAKAIGDGGGEVAILSAAATAENQNTWIGFMKEELKNFPDLKLVDTVYGDDDATKSADKAAALMQAHPDLKGIISPTTVGIAAAAKYISGSKYKGKVQVTGLGLPSEMRAYVKDGTVQSFGLWDPGMLGYLGIYAAASAASDIDISSGFTAGDKQYDLDADGVAIVGPPQEFNADNIDDFTF